jgi:heme oxygenase-like protein
MTKMGIATTQADSRAFPFVEFGPLRETQLRKHQATSDRHLYYYLLHADENADVLPTALERTVARLDRAEQCASGWPETPSLPTHADFELRLEAVRDWWVEKKEQVARSLGDVSREQCAYLLAQYAPTALLDGCWMQNVSSAATSHTELSVGMLKLYSHEIGDGDPARHHGNAYRDLKHGLGVYLPEVGSFAFAEQSDVTDASFRHPMFLLSISQFPRSFAPEILGLNLFYYICGICPLYLALRDPIQRHGATTRFLDLHMLDRSIDGPAETAVRMVRHSMETAAECTDGDVEHHWRRIRRGFVAACSASLDELDRGLRFLHAPRRSPREKMIELIDRKAHHAYGYHSDIVLEGRTLNEWLNPDRLDTAQFLDVFARSRYVSPGDSGGSLLFRSVLAFRGPMFRIFSPGEMQVIAEWIDSLPRDRVANDPPSPGTSEDRLPPALPSQVGSSTPPRAVAKDLERARIGRYAREPIGELYYYLLNIEYFPDVRPYARHFATRWLRLAGRGLNRGRRSIPFEPYGHGAMDSWLEAQYRRQVESYRGRKGEPAQSREELIDSTVQQAPMILIDGAWIQNSFNASTSHTRVGSKLFHIYYDEVGNGDVALNHPNVFRELLAQMGVELPEFGTLEFGRWPGFRPEAFRIPVFWLCLSQFPKRFLPETLGLNLAMELSGVGGAYRGVIDTLRYYGYDPCFIELHDTIDNVSTGHTAWAIEAIKCHMDEMLAHGGTELVEEHWRRVWTGYRSLVPPPGLVSWFARIF